MTRPWTALLLIVLAGCGSPPPADGPALAPGDVPDVVCLGYADVEGGPVALRPETPGRVTAVHVNEGDDVQPGAPLLSLDDAEARQELAALRASVRAAEVRVLQARQDLAQHPARLAQVRSSLAAASARLAATRIQRRRQEDLFSRNLISKDEVAAAREQVREAESAEEAAQARVREVQAADPHLAVRAAEAEVEAARARAGRALRSLDNFVVKAPEKGFVLTLAARPGEMVGHPGTPALVLFCPDRPFVVRAEVEQELVHKVRTGQPAQVRDELAGEGPWPGTVARISRLFVRRQHRTDPTQFVDVPTAECLIRLASGHPPLRIGQKLRVSIYPPDGEKPGP